MLCMNLRGRSAGSIEVAILSLERVNKSSSRYETLPENANDMFTCKVVRNVVVKSKLPKSRKIA